MSKELAAISFSMSLALKMPDLRFGSDLCTGAMVDSAWVTELLTVRALTLLFISAVFAMSCPTDLRSLAWKLLDRYLSSIYRLAPNLLLTTRLSSDSIPLPVARP